VLIYSDEGLTPITQPVLTDGFGHYDFYVLPGLYTLAVYYGNALQQVYVDQSIGGIGSAGGTSILLSTDSTPNFDQSALNLIAGVGISLFSDNLGNTTITGSGSRIAAITRTIDGGGAVIPTGLKGQISIPTGCTITGWVITSDQTGSCVVDVLRSSYPNFPTTVSIAGTDMPTLTAAQKNEDLALVGWGNTAINAGDQIQFNVVSATTVTRIDICLNVTVP
jgi:hypothetical protein